MMMTCWWGFSFLTIIMVEFWMSFSAQIVFSDVVLPCEMRVTSSLHLFIFHPCISPGYLFTCYLSGNKLEKGRRHHQHFWLWCGECTYSTPCWISRQRKCVPIKVVDSVIRIVCADVLTYNYLIMIHIYLSRWYYILMRFVFFFENWTRHFQNTLQFSQTASKAG